jgi:hypothetical protein
MKFKNPQNDYVETSSVPFLWALLFGPLYFAFKEILGHFIIFCSLASLMAFKVHTFSPIFVWIVYAFFASSIVESSYLRRGWVEAKPGQNTDPVLGNINKINAQDIFYIAAIGLVLWILATVFGK